MHKLECSAMIAFGENWCPSEISRLVARILAKKVGQLIKLAAPLFGSVVWLWLTRVICVLSCTESAEGEMCL